MSGTKIKICGLFRPCDARYVSIAKPDYAGFIFYEKSRRHVPEALARALRAAIDPEITTVGVFVDAPVERIARLCKDGTIGAIQLHGGEDGAFITDLRSAVPGVPIWAAYMIHSEADVTAAVQSAADMVLLDNGYGTGSSFDWSLIVKFPRPFILAGGLTPENIPEAIERFHPFAVDLSSGVETDGLKDLSKITAAVAAARSNS